MNLYGGYIPRPLKQWRWVFWTERRLVDAGVKEFVANQWEAEAELLGGIKADCPELISLGFGIHGPHAPS